MQGTCVNLLKELCCTRTQCISCPLNIVYIHSTTSLWEKETHAAAAAERKRWSSLYHFISRQKYYFSNHQPAEVKGMSDSRESKIYYRHFSDRYTIWNLTVFFLYRRNCSTYLETKMRAFHFFFYYLLLVVPMCCFFSLMHFLVKPLKSWAMIDYDEMVLLLLYYSTHCTYQVYILGPKRN